jgi:hypothetical protein
MRWDRGARIGNGSLVKVLREEDMTNGVTAETSIMDTYDGNLSVI